MSQRLFQFDLYRLNKIPGERTLFDLNPRDIDTDNDIENVLRHATDSQFFDIEETATHTARWDLRGWEVLSEISPRIVLLTILRSLVTTEGLVVTKTGFETSVSEIVPPTAAEAIILFHLDRHLVLVEHLTLTSRMRWRSALEEIISQAAVSLGYSGTIEFEPVAPEGQILETFHSFTKITKLKLTLRLPNPDLSRHAQHLFQLMKDGGVREFTQDMRNPHGISQDVGNLPHAAIDMAANGYKKGEIQMQGLQGKKYVKKVLGKKAARGNIEAVRAVLRSVGELARTKDAQKIVGIIQREIDRIAPSSDDESKAEYESFSGDEQPPESGSLELDYE